MIITVVLRACLPVACLTLGCAAPGPGPGASSGTGPVTSATTSVPTIAPAAPTLPARARAETRAGAGAFARHWWQAFSYVHVVGDASALASVSDPSCDFCTEVVDGVSGAAADGSTYRDVKVTAEVVAIDLRASRHLALVAVQASVHRSSLVAADGEVLETYPAVTRRGFDMLLRYQDSGWVVLEVGNPAS